MCGIAGIISASRIDQEDIDRALTLLSHRGPDAQGFERFVVAGNNAVFLHRRLSIIDLSTKANQPLSDAHTMVVYNGEIYNFLELRKELIDQGTNFRTHSDTEVILKLYQKEGMACVKRLRGMFAFALYDAQKQEIHLARDRMGQKPLYYYCRNGIFAFASTTPALLAFRDIGTGINLKNLNTFFTFNYNLSNDETLLENIYKLPPATVLTFKQGAVRLTRYWRINYTPKVNLSLPDAIKRTEGLIKEATRYRLISDVPLGFFLSGGIDSSLLVAMAATMSRKVKSFSIGFREEDYSELPYARLVTERYNTEHHEFIIEPDIITSLESIIPHLDEPMADPSSLPVYYLAQKTREQVTVAINGDGGDELFAGYEKYLGEVYIQQIRFLPASIRKALLKWLSNGKTGNSRLSFGRRLRWLLRNSLQNDSYFSASISFSMEEKQSLFSPDFFNGYAKEKNLYSHIQEEEGLDRLMRIDTQGYLPEDLLVKADRMTMAHSLEGRSPFLDHVLIDYVTKLPSEIKFKHRHLKFLLRKIAQGYLPREIVTKKKQGFGLPLNKWFREDLKHYFYAIMRQSRLVSEGILSFSGVEGLYNDHLHYRSNNGRRLYTILVAELWYRHILTHMQSPGPRVRLERRSSS